MHDIYTICVCVCVCIYIYIYVYNPHMHTHRNTYMFVCLSGSISLLPELRLLSHSKKSLSLMPTFSVYIRTR